MRRDSFKARQAGEPLDHQFHMSVEQGGRGCRRGGVVAGGTELGNETWLGRQRGLEDAHYEVRQAHYLTGWLLRSTTARADGNPPANSIRKGQEAALQNECRTRARVGHDPESGIADCPILKGATTGAWRESGSQVQLVITECGDCRAKR